MEYLVASAVVSFDRPALFAAAFHVKLAIHFG